MRLFTLLAAITFLSSCATPYRVPIEEAPPEWRDNGDPMGLAVIQGTTKTFDGEMRKGDILLEFGVENERVATVENDLEWKGPFGGAQKISAGSPAYARQFSLQRTTTYASTPIGPRTNMNAHNNPIEWCIPRETDAVCVFWEGPEKAKYISTSLGLAQNARPSSPSGMEGPMPVIAEKDRVAFAQDLRVRSSITRMNDSEVRIATRIYAGEDWNSFGGSVRRVKWSNGQEQTVNLFGAKYKISANFEEDKDVKSVNVTLIDAPDDIQLVSMQNAIEVINTLIALERAKAAASIAEEDDKMAVDEETPTE